MYMIVYIVLDKFKSVRYNVHVGDGTMLNTNITNFRKNIFSILEQTIKYNEPVNISTKEGNAVLISEEEYNGLRETICLSSIPDLREKTIEKLHTPLDDCLQENEVEL